jgi:hypothetical protein
MANLVKGLVDPPRDWSRRVKLDLGCTPRDTHLAACAEQSPGTYAPINWYGKLLLERIVTLGDLSPAL